MTTLEQYGIKKGGLYEISCTGATQMMIDFYNRPGMVSKSESWAKEISKLDGKIVKVTYCSYRNEMPYISCDECSKIIPLDCLKIYNEADDFAPDEGVSFF